MKQKMFTHAMNIEYNKWKFKYRGHTEISITVGFVSVEVNS